MDPIITITSTTTDALLAYAGQLFTDVLPLTILVIGIPLGFYVVSRVIGLVRTRTRK